MLGFELRRTGRLLRLSGMAYFPPRDIAARCTYLPAFPARNSLPGSLEDFAFAIGETLNALTGDLFEDRIDLFTQEVIRGEIVTGSLLNMAPGRFFLRTNRNQFALSCP